jgi:hypothetical protein
MKNHEDRTFQRLRYKWEDNIKLNFAETVDLNQVEADIVEKALLLVYIGRHSSIASWLTTGLRKTIQFFITYCDEKP